MLPTGQWQGIFTVIGCVGIVQSCLLGGSERTLGSMILLREWTDTGTAFLQKAANASSLSVFKRQFGQCPQQPALTSGQSCNGQAVRIGCYRSIPTGTRAGVLRLLFSQAPISHSGATPDKQKKEYIWKSCSGRCSAPPNGCKQACCPCSRPLCTLPQIHTALCLLSALAVCNNLKHDKSPNTEEHLEDS